LIPPELFHIPTVKDALGFVQWDVDDCPATMQLDEPAVDGPQEAGATEIVEGPLACTTRQIGDVCDLVPDGVGYLGIVPKNSEAP
jgi:hypothetical protein